MLDGGRGRELIDQVRCDYRAASSWDGIFPGMISPGHDPFDKDVILDHLGDKVATAVAEAVVATRADLAEYRLEHPVWVASSSERGLANWISDRLWDHLTQRLGDLDHAVIRELGPVREIIVHDRIRMRVKRHDLNGAIATFPTQTALSFYEQPGQFVIFDGLPEVYLAVGYVWERESREVGAPVVSLRDGVENLLWMYELPEPPIERLSGIPPVSGAPAPTVSARDETESPSAADA